MSKQTNIKWRVEDEQELRRVARNFNDKLRRLVKQNPKNKNILPQFYNEKTDQFESRLTIATLKNMIQTRADYNRQLNMLKRFSKRGAERIVEVPDNEYGTKTTLWQRQETARLVGIVNRKRQERLDKLNIVEMANSEGKLGYTLGEMFGMGLASTNKLMPTKAFTKSQSQTDLKYKMRSLIDETRTRYYSDRDLMLKNNYIKALLENYNENDISDVISRIKSMDSDLFVLKFEARGDKFEMAYPPDRDSEEYRGYVSELKGYWLGNTSILDLGGAGLTSALLNQ